MKHTEEEIEILAKSMYKAVKKALGTTNVISSDAKRKAQGKSGKDAIEDLMDPNFIAEAKDKTPVHRTAQMNKSKSDKELGWSSKRKARRERKVGGEKGVHDSFHDKGISQAGHEARFGKKPEHGMQGIASNKTIARQGKERHKDKLKELKNMKKPNLPKSEKDMVKSERGIEKLRKFIKNKHK